MFFFLLVFCYIGTLMVCFLTKITQTTLTVTKAQHFCGLSDLSRFCSLWVSKPETLNNLFVCDFRIHLQRRIEDEGKCDMLVEKMRQFVLHTHESQIDDCAVLEAQYIQRVLQLRKVRLHQYMSFCVRACVRADFVIFHTLLEMII